MARLVTLSTLQTRVQQRCNVEFASNATIVSTAELTDMVNEGVAELYDLITLTDDQSYYLKSIVFNTNASTDTYAIGAGQAISVTDFYKLRGVDVTFGQNIVLTARPFMWSERNRYKWYPGWIYSQPIFYRLTGNALKFIPQPNGQFTCTMWYIPTAPLLVNAADTFDGIDGFEEFVVLAAAVKLLTKQEQTEHAQVLAAERERTKDRVLGMAMHRDAENPPRVQDVQINDGWIGRPGY
jgi:hypothetical protein